MCRSTALITGIFGQDGSYLASLLLIHGYRVVGLVRPEVAVPAEKMAVLPDGVELVRGSLLDERNLRDVVEKYAPQEIYNLAARASSSQFLTEPVLTGDVNGMAVVKLLEVIRTADTEIRFCQASSSEMFGRPQEAPQTELTPFRPRNPYGVAKLFAHGMVGTYRENFGLFACSCILFNHESPRRSREFVTRKITSGVASIKAGLTDSLSLGDLDATRDWGFAGDYARAMWQMLRVANPDDYVIATGESHSVREFCELAFAHVGLDYRNYVRIDQRARRPVEPVPLVGDAAKARACLGWRPTLSFEELVHAMVDSDVRRLRQSATAEVVADLNPYS